MIKKNILIVFLLFFISSCSTLKDGFESQRKNSTEEFLVEKKRPLVMPPDYNKLPMPREEKVEETQIEQLLEKNKTNSRSKNKNTQNKTTENFILDKINTN
tara:strand:- start:46 stop:348 length:303 start_codon:yes stop_codon:yes gene_type:complete